MRLSALVASTLILAVAACAPSAVDSAAEASAVQAAYERYRQGAEAEDLSAVESAFASGERALIFFTGGTGFRGAAAIVDGYRSWFAAVDSIRLRPRDLQVHVGSTGQVAWVSYLEDGSMSVEGERFEWESRRATLVWEKFDGQWRMVHAHWSDPDDAL